MNSEVIDLYDTGVTCQPWPDHPVGTNQAVGGLINDQLFIICGGQTPNGITNLCHTMTPSQTYTSPFNLTVASRHSASVVLDEDRLFITGGLGNLKKSYIYKLIAQCLCYSFYLRLKQNISG